MCSYVNIEPILMEPPLYIRDILRSSKNIYLVYNSRSNKPDINIQQKDNAYQMEDSTNTLDLTGNPLETNLSNISLIPLDDNDVCLQEENKQFPIPLNDARKIINRFNKKSCERDDNDYYIFCVCDGADKKCTLVLGACQTAEVLSRIEICNKGCYNQRDSFISLENMKQEHLDNINVSNCQITYLVFATYTTYGNNLINYKISNTMPTYAAILYNTSWNIYQYQVPEFVQFAEMIVQIVPGHVESEIYAYWEQLVVLQTYARQLKARQTDLDKVIQAGSQKSYTEITQEISRLLDDMHGLRRIPFKKRDEDHLNLENLRQEDLVDKLWNILLSCSDIGDIRICFHFLFEELVSRDYLKPIISEDNKSTIAAIIKELSRGKLSVPTLSSIEALEYLVELGIEKLKRDYCYILNHFNCLNHQEFEKYWNQLNEEYDAEVKSLGTTETGRTTFKRVRSTIQQTSILDCKILKKIFYVAKMHIACEFLVLCNKVKLPTKESFTTLIESINEQILNVNHVVPPKYISECMLQEIKVKLQSNDVKFLQSKHPVTWNVRFTSTYDSSSLTTIFHHSLQPLFPPCTYNTYDVPVTEDVEGPCYYVSKLVNFTEKL